MRLRNVGSEIIASRRKDDTWHFEVLCFIVHIKGAVTTPLSAATKELYQRDCSCETVFVNVALLKNIMF